MSHRRSRIAVAAVVLLAIVATACGSSSKKSSTGTTTTAGKKVGMVYDLGGRGDKSFNDAAARGLDQAKKEFNLDVKELEPNAGGQNREELLRLLTTQGYPLIFSIGFLFSDSVTAVSKDNPNTTYGIVDSVVSNPNVASLVFAEEQGSYLVGAAAALKSKTHHIGFIGGVDTDLIKKFEAGYVAGAKKIDPTVKIDVKYITEPPDFGGFNDTAKGKEIGLGMYNGGADVVYHAAGGSGTGLFNAAVEASASGTQKWAIGVDSDQYTSATADQQKHILTSMIKRVDVAVYDTIKDYVNGSVKKGATTTFDLKADGVAYSTSGGFVDDIKAQLEQLKSQIIAGTITVPTKP